MPPKNLPAGLIDGNLEIFANGTKVMALKDGLVCKFSELDLDVQLAFRQELNADKEAWKALNDMQVQDSDKLKQYVWCRYGAFDLTPDLDETGTHEEYFDCGKRGSCLGEGRICLHLKVNDQVLTAREVQVIKLVAEGLQDKEIASKLDISSSTASNHIANIKRKLGYNNKQEITGFAFRNNLIK